MKNIVIKAILLIVVLAAGYGLWGYFFNAPKNTAAMRSQTPIVEVTQAKRMALSETIEAVGTTRAFESITITAKSSGVISDISFGEGDTVEAKRVLFKLDARERLAERDQVLAQIAEAKSKKDDAVMKLERAKSLTKSGAVTEARVDELTAQVDGAQGNVASLEARLRITDTRLEDMVIIAPFAGRVGLRNVSVGALVEAGARLTTLDDISKIRLDFSVPERDMVRLKEDLVVNAQSVSYPGQIFTGKVEAIDSRIDPTSRMVRLTALLPNEKMLLKPGMFVQLSLNVQERQNAIMVPEEALTNEGQKTFLYEVQNGKAIRRFVESGLRKDGLIEIVQGLSADAQIVTRGIQRLKDGAPVQVKEVAKEQPKS